MGVNTGVNQKMSTANEQSMSHADRHDLDKLARWKAGLDGAADSGAFSFPACAIFLVTGEDRASHDIFRRYRSAFEEFGAGFHHLVIFGQHGVSTTQTAFLGQLGLDSHVVPALAIAPMSGESGVVYAIDLPSGDRDGDLDEAQPWGVALRVVETVEAEASLSLDGIAGISRRRLAAGSLRGAVGSVLNALNGDA